MFVGLSPVLLGLVGVRSVAWLLYFPGLLIGGVYGMVTEGSAEIVKGAPYFVLFCNIMFFGLCGASIGYLWNSHETR